MDGPPQTDGQSCLFLCAGNQAATCKASLPREKIRGVLETQILPRFTNCFMQASAHHTDHKPQIPERLAYRRPIAL